MNNKIISFIVCTILIFSILLPQFVLSINPVFVGSLVITRRVVSTNVLQAVVLNLNSGTLINYNHKRYQVSNEILDNVRELLSKLDKQKAGGFSMDLRDNSIASTYVYFMANTQYGKSIVWQDGTEGDNSILLTVETFFDTYQGEKEHSNVGATSAATSPSTASSSTENTSQKQVLLQTNELKQQLENK